ncbi:HEAT repeat domain-containing protein [Gilvibacter sediminis]|uniref:HEAT repeat domain-containing protein n=1 Tax=Gilvibacter sediminis TaxID=379071 RepID=UPI002350B916|nr:HEAT repeat domain-containing protein [Gilvibacter sediminis]MDC7998961.1 HEAT repeat domain-containing protein [Gilvibacter sediminis]
MSLEKQLERLKSEGKLKQWPESQDVFFEARLKKEFHSSAKKPKTKWWYAVAAVLVLGMLSIPFLNNDSGIDPAQQEMLDQIAAMEYPSEQLEALAAYQESQDRTADENFQKVLISLLSEETQTNVKIEAITALKAFGQQEEVRTALLGALSSETEALVQIKLIKTLAELKETRATDPLEQIVADRNQEAAVRNTASLAVAAFNNQ